MARRAVIRLETIATTLPLACLSVLLLSACGGSSSSSGSSKAPVPPNILFVIMDDVGIDQVPAMGYGGAQPAHMPSIDAIAQSGVRFRNTWAMPECSPGRAALLTGRYPLRSNVYQAIGPNDLANSQISPYEITTPKLLQNAGYESAMFGKFHLAGPDYNPAENGTPRELGWDYFYGWTGGLPGSIDTTAGGAGAEGTYTCGYVPSLADDSHNGANTGACYIPDAQGGFSCTMMQTSLAAGPAGLQCLTGGGVLLPHATACEATPPAQLRFDRENAHYVSPLVINSAAGVEELPLTDPRGRGYRSIIEAEAARDWILSRDGSKPWMATVSFSAPHTPLQTPPATLLKAHTAHQLNPDCRLVPSTIANQRHLTDAMVEAMDYALGQLLVDTGIALRADTGELIYQPYSNTLVVIVGDNGSFGPTVKAPFDPTRAKGTAYQTGVWVPLIVAGPMIQRPDRDVEHMINATDVFRLFGEVAGLDVDALTPAGTDSVAMLPYLINPAQSSLRDHNFTQGGLNIQLDGGRNGPCVIGPMCSHTPVSKTVCEDNGGVWWGKGADDPVVVDTYDSGELEQCWQVNQAIYHAAPADYEQNRIAMGWTRYQAVRNDHYKLVHNHALDYDISTDGSTDLYSEELYAVSQSHPPQIDRESDDLLRDGVANLGTEAYQHYLALNDTLASILASKPGCPGDGNNDGRVDDTDLANFDALIASGWHGSSWYDFNHDGITDQADRDTIAANLGTVCPPTGPQ